MSEKICISINNKKFNKENEKTKSKRHDSSD